MTRDNNKGISIDYNYLNLPQQITFDSGDEIHYLYTAEGQKLQKRIVEQAGSASKTDYFGGRIYESGTLKEIAHEEGRILATTTGFEYHYYLHDHLGNVRVEFKQDADGEAAITQENHYYPFGMRFSGEVFANNDNDFRYNGKEMQLLPCADHVIGELHTAQWINRLLFFNGPRNAIESTAIFPDGQGIGHENTVIGSIIGKVF